MFKVIGLNLQSKMTVVPHLEIELCHSRHFDVVDETLLTVVQNLKPFFLFRHCYLTRFQENSTE